MSELATDEAKAAVANAITEIEKKTSAEVVVVKRAAAGDYRAGDFLWGAVFALALLCFFLYSPEPFDFTIFPLEQAAAFLIGAIVSAHVPAMRRAFVPKSMRHDNVVSAAHSAFFEKGISKTKRRTGVLVFVARFEEDAVVVLDVGLDRAKLGQKLKDAESQLRRAIPLHSTAALVDALKALGDALAAEYPVTDDDEDELSNEVAA